MVGICTTILHQPLLREGRLVFTPLAFALLVIAIVWPVQRTLQAKLPKLVALALSTLLTFLIVIAFVSIITSGISPAWRAMSSAKRRRSNRSTVGRELARTARCCGRPSLGRTFQYESDDPHLSGVLEHRQRHPELFVDRADQIIIGLLEVDVAAQKLGMVRSQEVSQRLLAGLTATAAKLRRYMAVRTMMSIATGLLVWAFASVTGLQLALEWGVIAFMRNSDEGARV